MTTSMQQAIRSSGLKPLVLPLFRVRMGTKCKHTGLKVGYRGKKVSTGYPQDKDLMFTKTHIHCQHTTEGKEIILGLSDLVEVVK